MSDATRPYVIHSEAECERLERQAVLGGIDDHLRYIPPITGNARILDLGCGSGAMTRLFAAQYPKAEVWGVDLREDYVKDAGERAAELPNACFRTGDVYRIPFPDAHFDLVWSKYVMQFIRDPVAAMAECRRVTRPGGAVIHCAYDGFMLLHEPSESSLQARLERVLPEITDPYIGRKLAPAMLVVGLQNVTVHIEADRCFTIVGAVDPERRRNLEVQFEASMPYIEKVLGSAEAARRLASDFLAYWDRSDTCSYAALYFVRGTAP